LGTVSNYCRCRCHVSLQCYSRYNAVRATWETTHHQHCSDDSPTLPLLHQIPSQVSLKMQQQKHNTIPGPGRRLTTGFGMLNKPINTIRNKAFSRASRHASSDTMGGEGVHTRQSESLKSLRQASKENKRSEKVARSQTMSFLPVPTKVSFSSPLKQSSSLISDVSHLLVLCRHRLCQH
jgi:hypothetical protein